MGGIITMADVLESKRLKERAYQECMEKLNLSEEQIEPFQKAFHSTFKGCLIKRMEEAERG